MSVAERVTAEASNRTGDLLRLKNARKTYSVTVGRLRWNAKQGAVVVLPVTTRERRDQALVVPVASIPMAGAGAGGRHAQSSSSSGVSELPVSEHHTREIDGSSGALRGDLVWPRNVGADRDAVADGPQCVAERGPLPLDHRAATTGSRNSRCQPPCTPRCSGSFSGATCSRGRRQRASPQSLGVAATAAPVDVVVQRGSCCCLGARTSPRVERFLEPYHLAQLLVNRDASSAFMPPSFVLQADLLHLSGELLSRSAPLNEF
ncbi:hypothetical protein PINS_up015236 [Pythium insidiosum]|nr:hypothetical protein PINS_up015236 [Pythium insidiosum]